jgi:DNA-binding PadR family transcriptional regulator
MVSAGEWICRPYEFTAMAKITDETSLTNLLKGNTTVFILSILKEGPSHGYAIYFEIARRSNNVLHFKQGTVYPLLHVLESDALISSEWQETAPGNKRRRRVYSITEKGLRQLNERLDAWRVFSQAMIDLTGVEPGVKRS